MKKSFSVNIDGRIFNIDEDAYDLLQSYLKQLGTAFGNGDDSDEIVSDIEARVSEHLAEMCPTSVVSIRDINSVIDIIGRPEQIGAEAAATSDTEDAENTPPSTPPPSLPRHRHAKAASCSAMSKTAYSAACFPDLPNTTDGIPPQYAYAPS